jgi:DNA-binding NtrC family response regulator
VLLDMKFDVPDDRLLPLAEGASARRTRRFQGVAILREIRSRFPDLPVVCLTSVQDLSLIDAAEELSSQSMTYLLDSEDLDALRIRLNSAVAESSQGVEETKILWGENPSMRALRRRLSVLAKGRIPVIIEGETGTGKSYLAENFLHANSGRPGRFVTADLSTVPRDLVPAYLFGALRGSYTGAVTDRKGLFQMAHGGTLFIDEIQNIPIEVQKQLLVVLQEGKLRPIGSSDVVEVDVKVIAASNTALAAAVSKGRFRSDLYMRLSPATAVVIPPLRDRLRDLPFLAKRFATAALAEPEIDELRGRTALALGLSKKTEIALDLGRDPKKSTPDGRIHLVVPEPAWNRLREHRWYGNVRELSVVMRNIVTFTLVEAMDAVRSGLRLTHPRLQVDTGLVGELLKGSSHLRSDTENEGAQTDDAGFYRIRLAPGKSLSDVASFVERQYFTQLYLETHGDFSRMAKTLLDDPEKGRAVRLRFNQLGLKVREMKK